MNLKLSLVALAVRSIWPRPRQAPTPLELLMRRFVHPQWSGRP